MRVVINGNDGGFVHQDRLGLLVQIITLLVVRSAIGFGEQAIIFPVGPAGLIVAAPGDEHVDERFRIHIIRDPGKAADLVIQRSLIVQVHLPFLVFQFDIDVQILLPHLLDGFGYGAVGFHGVIHECQTRKPVAVPKPMATDADETGSRCCCGPTCCA